MLALGMRNLPKRMSPGESLVLEASVVSEGLGCAEDDDDVDDGDGCGLVMKNAAAAPCCGKLSDTKTKKM